jgi:O-antigen ligase
VTEADRTSPRAGFVSFVMAARHDPRARILNVDLVAIVVAALLPWTTTGVAMAVVLWIIAVSFTIDPPGFLRALRQPASILPLASFVLAVLGTSWSVAPGAMRPHGINPTAKLLLIPLLLYHFQRSQRALWVLAGFIISCTLLMILSCIVLLQPGWKLGSAVAEGVAVKNYVDQSQEFAFCIFALAWPAMALFRQRRFGWAAACVALMACFFANMMFVVTARTALVCIPVLLALFAIRQLSGRAALTMFAVMALAVAMTWFGSPYLRERITKSVTEYRHYQEDQMYYQSPTSPVPEYLPNATGLRLEYWRKSLNYFGAAPILGNGTGSIRSLFERDAVGQENLAAAVVDNPHNQTLGVAVQWGMAGVILLYAMWLSHLLLFRDATMAGWIGLMVVVQNMVSSLFNSHLVDFVEGWMYVLGVGIAGGVTLGAKQIRAAERADEGRSAHAGQPAN